MPLKEINKLANQKCPCDVFKSFMYYIVSCSHLPSLVDSFRKIPRICCIYRNVSDAVPSDRIPA